MSFIHFTTNKVLTLNQELKLQESVFEIFSSKCKEEKPLMVHIEDNQLLYYSSSGDCMQIECCLNQEINKKTISCFVNELLLKVEQLTQIPSSRIYVTIEQDKYKEYKMEL